MQSDPSRSPMSPNTVTKGATSDSRVLPEGRNYSRQCLDSRPFMLEIPTKNAGEAGQWWLTPLIPALSRQRQADLQKKK